MLLSHLLSAAVLAAAAVEPSPGLTMRIPTEGLDLSRAADAAAFAGRVAEESRRFCEVHAGTVTPGHVGDRRVCERAMAGEAVSALSSTQWRDFMRAGGAAALRRAQRQDGRAG